MVSEGIIKRTLASAGIEVNGHQHWDIQVKHPRFFGELLRNPELKLGETYMQGWWECERLDLFFERVFSLDRERAINSEFGLNLSRLRAAALKIYERFCNLQSMRRSRIVGEKHYDLGNDLFEMMLDKRLIYSCAYWATASDLDEAQEAKLDLICRKLQLEPGMTLLDIGCGWGGLARFAAERYGVRVTGVTISKEQQKYALKMCDGLPVSIALRDYRELNDQFDRVCSVGMFEHVGHKNYAEYFRTVRRCLKPDGLFLLHTIGKNYTTLAANAWIRKYIFPNGMLPSIQQIAKASEKSFVMEDWHNFGADYDRTLMAWHVNFNRNWDLLNDNYTEEFRRMWSFYLLSCAGAFRTRDIQLWQVVLSHPGSSGTYRSPR